MARLRNPATGVVMTVADELAARLRAEGWELADKSAAKTMSEPTSESTDDKSAAKSASKKPRK